ncbi:hypothetical protein H0H81_009998 [Sphagnurus paluster]|uniref:RING-type domain-containing protein n=1 Tax=Sphagnurus paluster TaxID=117069 RepID=A0A9P7GM67_9AGAR|nr:hypothetical protein H0H81_009998 [Sphagnurus paluster]
MALLTSDATKKNIALDAMMVDLPLLDDASFIPILETYQPTEEEFDAKPVPHKVTMFKRVSASVDLIEEANSITELILNEQSTLLWEWRTHMISLLTQKLASSEDQPDGDEYQRTLDNQGEAETYLQCYTALLADRRQALLNERTLLAAHDVREKKLRHTKAAMNAANAVREALLQISDEIEFQPEHEVLHSQLSKKRKELLNSLDGRAIKSVLVDLNTAATRVTREKDPERVALKEAVTELRRFIAEQTPIMDQLDADLVLIRKAFNQRILYFRQLQEISDTVAEVNWDGTVVEALLQASLEKDDLDADINKSRARQRYLDNLAKDKEDGIEDEDEGCCILCRCEFVRGFITQCAHVFCEGCMKAWLLRKEGKTCPVCRIAIDPDTIQRFTITLDKSHAKPAQQGPNGEAIPKSRRKISYNMIKPQLFNEITSMESFGDYGSKIQTLVQHLLYLKVTDPGAKSIVFSAWANSLLNTRYALEDSTNTSADMVILQLSPELTEWDKHGRPKFIVTMRKVSGYILRQLFRSSELVIDTVERNILDLAARQGLSLYTKENSAGTLNVSSFSSEPNSKVVKSPKKTKKAQQKGDFIFKMDDMLAILFPHMYEDVEYLIPEALEDADMESVAGSRAMVISRDASFSMGHGNSNAVAGPSNLG